MHCTGLLAPPDAAERDAPAKEAEKSLRRRARIMWLPEAAAKALKEACEAIKCAIKDPELGQAKGNALRVLLGTFNGRRSAGIGVVADPYSNRLSVKRWLEKKALTVLCFCPPGLPRVVSLND